MSPGGGALLEAIGEIARTLDRALVEELASQLEALPEASTPGERLAVARRFAPTAARAAVMELFEAWTAAAPEVPPLAVACGLRAADAVDAWHRRRTSTELVWTGPVASGSRLRRTDQALLEIIAESRRALLIVSFSVHGAERLHDALVDALRRGVRVRLALESPEESRGRLDSTSRAWLTGDLAAGVERYVWPYAAREKVTRPSGGQSFGLLHAKCAVADDDALFVSSANLTDHAMDLNMELGILVRGGALPGEVRRHFDELIDGGVLVWTRRELTPE